MADNQEDEIENATVEDGKNEIDDIANLFMSYLTSKSYGISPKRFMKAYSIIVKLCDQDDGSQCLYYHFQVKMKNYVLTEVSPKIQAKDTDSKEFLDEYCKQWSNFSLFLFCMKKLMVYLDRYHLKTANQQSLTETSLIIFKKNVYEKKINQLRNNILAEIAKDRVNDIVDKDLIKLSIQQFLYMGFDKLANIQRPTGSHTIQWFGEKNLEKYDNEFEKYLRETTTDFYRRSAAKWLNEMSCEDYVRKVAQHLLKEERNADYFLQEQTKARIVDIVLKEAVESPAEQLTLKETGCEYMFNQRKIGQLQEMYEVFSRVDTTLKFVINKMTPFIMEEGRKIIKNEENLKDPLKFTAQLLAFKAEMDEIIATAFKNDMKFQKARDMAFQNFMNECDKTPHYIAFYTDNEFKKGLKSLADDKIEQRLDAIVRLFCCLHGRDVFIARFTGLLAQRLLNKTSVSNEAEQLMVKKLQVECGHNTVNKIKTMFEDIMKSQQTMQDYRDRKHDGSKVVRQIEFQAEILTCGHWPFQDAPKCTIPAQMQHVRGDFNAFYMHNFRNRQIVWLYNHGQLQLETTYLTKKYQIIANCFQVAILCLFNEHAELTYQGIQERTSLADQDMMESLLKLCAPKSQLLLKENVKVPKFKPDEKIRLNASFQNNNIRIQVIPQPSTAKLVGGGAGAPSVADVDSEVVKERSQIIEAVTVRVMKARKTEQYGELVNEIIRQISMFQAEPAMIKKRIESLIDREYLERAPNERSKLIYKP